MIIKISAQKSLETEIAYKKNNNNKKSVSGIEGLSYHTIFRDSVRLNIIYTKNKKTKHD
jgi:hypothetical protein